jgi:predicted ATP-dependent endonuclease of OLD family
MPLESFSLRGFQSYSNMQTVPLDPNLTLITGRNNVGKSSLLRAMRIFEDQQEGAYDDFRISYRWTVDSERLETGGILDVSRAFASRQTHTVSASFDYRRDPASADDGNAVVRQNGWQAPRDSVRPL